SRTWWSPRSTRRCRRPRRWRRPSSPRRPAACPSPACLRSSDPPVATDPIQRLILRLARLPGIGEKTATRLAFHILRAPEGHARELAQAILEVREKIRLCSVCCNLTEADPCALCADARRDGHMICVVAQPTDLIALDRAGQYRGRYHVLHGVL